jgi:aldose 1-epimerase
MYSSPNGEEGYPGTLSVTARYSLPDPFTLQLDLAADTDQPTVVNLTAHPYFNLAGHGDILNHRLTIPATHFTPIGAGLIPTGEIAPVADTPLDFRTPTAIGARIHEPHPQLVYGSGYDHNFVFKRANTPTLAHMARLADPDSGRMMDVYATHSGIQVYSCNFLNNTPNGRGGAEYAPYSGIALEPQAFPDSPNQPLFPSTLVTPDHPYRQTILYQFTIPHA